MTTADPHTELPSDPDRPPLSASAALTEVMRRVEGIAKSSQNTQGSGYFFRGIDAVMNTVGPILRDLGLLVIPELREMTTEQVQYGNNRTYGFHTQVKVIYILQGPDGSSLTVGPIPGEAIDSGDKSTTKAMSVAFRTMWLQTLCVPTNEPDPDESTYAMSAPETTVNDPVLETTLRERVSRADTTAKGRSAWAAIVDAHAVQGKITTELRDELQGILKSAMEALAQGGQQQRGETFEDYHPADDASPGSFHGDGTMATDGGR